VCPQKKPPEQKYSNPKEYFKTEMLKSYVQSKSMMHIQEQIALRALDLSEGKPPGLILDLGMGAGFSCVPLYLKGFTVIGIELIWDMLIEYPIPELNPIAGNMLNLPFRGNTFDFIFSVSAFQWTLTLNGRLNKIALKEMFKQLYRILKPTGTCVFQLYESNRAILDNIYAICKKNGFKAKYLIDNPQSKKKKKIFLYLTKNVARD
jgi:SAM-dependent methyltransferase